MTQNGSPSWSPDGKQIAFDSTTANRDFSVSRLYVISLDEKRHVTDLGNGVMPTWSSDSKRIAFMLNPNNPTGLPSGIWVTDPTGTETQWLGEGGSPRWSPRGDLIATADYGRQRAVYLIDVESGERRRLFNSDDNQSRSRLTWSPDGRRLAFVPATPFGSELFWLVDVDTDQPAPKPLGNVPDAANYPPRYGVPVWSPDGKRMLFQMFPNQNRGSDLYVISTDNPGPPQKIDHPKMLTSGEASWSPDGTRIVFAGRLVADE